LLTLLGGATIVVVSRWRVKNKWFYREFLEGFPDWRYEVMTV